MKYRLAFDEELLPEDNWANKLATDEFEVEVILDGRFPMWTGTDRPVREFKVKWVDYCEPSWEPVSNLSCGGLLYGYQREHKRTGASRWSKWRTKLSASLADDDDLPVGQRSPP
ncbi:hypothetical protein PC116_g5121 [Phytophthora cactorum]|uniref:Chromo domain-containing protein n=1 Tax=Phytophthora cactorum TaxID=29920 RepID=A0A329SHS8_9STRA|nr:hypothetical protein Pcac1_g18076 [Phytophthora cactorum]KAG2913145.1 hypothetical protein PC114_g8649 [Phytophthora cactorum]KAG2922887.1 hypothetical protein PC117_g15881 [Phytophthora cactorum]KAG4247097.1 hypothetical protein PC116_g5121 [Phytophthora cactorum]RAW36343.1 hypothetical protein PC110_g7390 [Phytophthora cactorum]